MNGCIIPSGVLIHLTPQGGDVQLHLYPSRGAQ